MTRLAAVACGGLLVASLSACTGSVDDGALRALEAMEGVESAGASCYKGRCTTLVDVAPDVRSDGLGTIIDAARETRAREIEVRLPKESGRVVLETGPDEAADLDSATAEVMLAAVADDQLSHATIIRRDTSSSLSLGGDGPRRELWASAERLWTLAEQASAEQIVVAGSAEDVDEGPTALTGSSFPSRAAELVTSLDDGGERARPHGVRIEDDTVVLGALSLASAEAVEAAVDGHPEARGLEVEVEVTRGLPSDVAGGGQGSDTADEGQQRAILKALEDQGLAASVQDRTVRVRKSGGGDDTDLAAAVDAARVEHPEAARVVHIAVDLGPSQVVELGTSGSPELIDLGTSLVGRLEAEELEIKHRAAGDDEPAGLVLVTVPAPDLADGVQGVSEVFADWETSETEMTVSVTARDPEGRSPRVLLRVSRAVDTWTARGTRKGTSETIRESLEAWRAGA